MEFADDLNNFFYVEKGKSHVAFDNLKVYAFSVFCPVTFNNTLYIYDKKTGLYQADPKGLSVKEWFEDLIARAISDSNVEFCSESYRPKKDKDDLFDSMLSFCVYSGDESPFNKYNGIPVENGVIVFDNNGSAKLTKYEKEMLFTRKIPTAFNCNADLGHISSVLSDWVGDSAKYLIQIAAQALVQSLPSFQNIKKAYLFVGEHDGGKSTCLDLYKSLFGSKNVTGIKLQDLQKDFSFAALEGKYLNAGDELAMVTMDEADRFKSVISKKMQTVERKYENPYETEITAVHVFACNKPPKLSQTLMEDEAWWVRWIIVYFPNHFEQISDWKKKYFTAENLEGFLYLAVELAGRMIAAGGKIFYSQDADDTESMWICETDSLQNFITENLEFGCYNCVNKDELLEGCLEFRNNLPPIERSHIPTNKTGLTRALKKHGIIPVQERELGTNKYSGWVYRGVGWKAGGKYAPQH